MKTIEVDPRVPGIRDEIPFPQAKQCSPELDFPSCQFSFPFSQKFQRFEEKPIVKVVEKSDASWIFQGRYQGPRVDSSPLKTPVM